MSVRLLRTAVATRHVRRAHLARIGRRGVPVLLLVARLSLASVLAFLLANAITPGTTDLTGPLTALLVVQTSLYATLKSGVFRLAAVLTGVLTAIGLSSQVGLSWWSLGLVISVALLAGHLLRLGDHLLEAPISAMLILGVTQHDVAAQTRVVNTLVGAGVGIALTLLLPPSVRPVPAEEAVADVASATAEVIRRAGGEMAEGLDRRRVAGWLGQTHDVLPRVTAAEEAIAQVEENRRLNPRALGSADVAPILRSGLAALDRTVLSLRAMFQALEQEMPHRTAAGDVYDEELRGAFSVVLLDMGDAVENYGSLVVAEAEGRQVEAEDALAETLEILRETRAILTELYLVDGREDPSAWLLRGSVLAGVEGVLNHLDVEARARQRRQILADTEVRRLHVPSALTRLTLPRWRSEADQAVDPRGPLWPGA